MDVTPNEQDTERAKEQKREQEEQKMRYFSYGAIAITIMAVLLIIIDGISPYYLAMFLVTVIWLVMILFYFFEKFLDWLKAYLDNQPSKPK